MAAVQQNLLANLWAGPADSADSARQLTSGRWDGLNGLAFMPDGRIVYTGDHAQNWDLFVVDADGANSRQLTFDGHNHMSPAVCDDGRAIVYYSHADGADHLWKLDLQSGNSIRLTSGPGEDTPRCGGNGHWVVYRGQTADGSYIYKLPVSGAIRSACQSASRSARHFCRRMASTWQSRHQAKTDQLLERLFPSRRPRLKRIRHWRLLPIHNPHGMLDAR